MSIKFERTMNEAAFKRALLDTDEERIARELHPEPDLKIEGFEDRSLLSRLIGLFGSKPKR
jgi:hypothetical protein